MPSSGQTEYLFGPFHYDSARRLLFRGSEMVPLEPKVADTLRVLLEHNGRVVEKAELLREVWPGISVDEVGLARNISRLRKALGDEAEASLYVETLSKRGYRFVAPVEIRRAGEAKPAAPGKVRRLTKQLLYVLLGVAALAMGLGVIYWQFYHPSRYFPRSAQAANVAVVPFTCLSPELDCGAFPYGLNDLLVARLSQFAGVHVLSPSTVYRFQRARLSMAFMARMLGMDALVEGTIQHAGDQVRITARLVDVHSAKLIWSDSFEYPAQNLAGAQNRAAEEIALQAGLRLASPGHPAPPRR